MPNLPSYWHSVAIRAFWDSFKAFETNPKLLWIGVLGVIITATLVLIFRGWKAFTEHVIANIFIALGGAVLTWLLALAWIFVHLPAKIQSESNANLSRIVIEKRQQSIAMNAQLDALTQLRAENHNLRSQLAGFGQSEPDNSLRRKILRLANKLEDFNKKMDVQRQKESDQLQSKGFSQFAPNVENQGRYNADMKEFEKQIVMEYQAGGLRDQVVGILGQLKNAGVNVSDLDPSAQQPIVDGELIRLRDFAYQVDSRDQKIEIPY